MSAGVDRLRKLNDSQLKIHELKKEVEKAQLEAMHSNTKANAEKNRADKLNKQLGRFEGIEGTYKENVKKMGKLQDELKKRDLLEKVIISSRAARKEIAGLEDKCLEMVDMIEEALPYTINPKMKSQKLASKIINTVKKERDTIKTRREGFEYKP